MNRRGCILLLAGLLALMAPLNATGISPRRYLFLDPAILVQTEAAQLTANPASRRETVIRPDRAWENLMISFFLTVREEEGKLRMWYVCRDGWGKDSQVNVAYAESTDGIRWSKPDLGIYDYKGSRANNLIGLHTVEGVVFRDDRMPSEERYQYVAPSKPANDPSGEKAIYRFYSSDGLRWKQDDRPLIQAGSDTQNVVWWDERLQEYVLILRGFDPDPVRRKVSRLGLRSLKSPTGIKPSGRGYRNFFYDEIPVILVCDERDPSRTDIYNMSAQPYPLDPAWYVGFPTFLRRSAKTDAPGWKSRHMGPAEVQFAGSSDTMQWHRHDRRAYVSPGIASPEKKNMTFMGAGLIVRGDEIWQYGTEYESVHGDVEARLKKKDGVIVRYVQRVDGFVSLDTGNAVGTARTVPVRVTGKELRLNIDTGALGELRVGLRDAAGRSIAGFAAEECVPLEYNGTGAVVSWAGGADLSALQGREVVVEFQSNRTKLYSFRFE